MNNNAPRKNRLDALWGFFTSVRLTVVVLLLLAATSVVGTLIPQNASPQAYIQAYGEFAYRLLHVFNIFDMYYSWWFRSLIAILAVNITVCTIHRWPSIWRIVASGKLRTASLEKRRPLTEFSDRHDPRELREGYRACIRRKFPRARLLQEGKGFRVVAERGRWTRLGVPAVHLSIVVILAGALIGSFFGFDGFVNIPEGGSVSQIRLRNSDATLPLGFEVRCDDFDVSFYKSGSPKEFRSSLVILENGRKVLEKDIIVNDPLRYRGINFFQSSYGPMPPKKITLTFTSRDSGRTVRHQVAMGRSVALPEGGGRFTVGEYRRDYRFRGVQVGAAVLGVLERPGQAPAEIALPLRFPTFDRMRKGDWILSVAGLEEAYYTGLQVTRDPGVPVVYAGFVLLILGCWVAFFMSHQKIVVDVRPSAHSSRVKIFGTANRNRLGFENKVRKLGAELSRLSPETQQGESK